MKNMLVLAALMAASSNMVETAFSATQGTQTELPQQQLQQAAYDMLVLQNGGTGISPSLSRGLEQQIGDALRNDGEILEMETEFPGLVEHLVKAVTPIALRQVNDTMPDLFQRQAVYYAEKMTAAEISAATAFYSRPEYPAIQKKVQSKVDVTEIMTEAVRSGDEEFKITGDALNDVGRNAATQALSEFTAQEFKLLLEFGLSPHGRKLTLLRPGATNIEAQWSNESTPEEDKELEDVVIKAMSEFTGLDFSQ